MSDFLRSRSAVLTVISAFCAIVVLAVLVGYGLFRKRLDHAYPVTRELVVVPRDAASRARGEHLARTLAGCAECHGADFGGRIMGEDSIARVVAPNLTPGRGSVVRDFKAGDWLRAIVHGTKRSGESLLLMPSEELRNFSDEDLSAVIAFCETLTPVDRDLGTSRVSLLGAVFIGLTQAPIFSAEGFDHTTRHVRAPERAATAEYGLYLANVCRGCHGADLRGGIVVKPGSPRSKDISPTAMAGWSFAQFERALREGKRRDGSDLDEAMPWGAMRGLRDEELRALWLGLRHK